MLSLNENKKDSIKAAIGTALFVMLLISCCFLLGLYRKNPPPPEEGVEVNLGDSDFGSGDALEPTQDQLATRPQIVASNNSIFENISTQSTDESVAILKNKEDKKDTQKKPQEEVPEDPVINQNALFKGKNSSSRVTGSQGETTGYGNQGKEGGDPSSNRYDGVAGNGGPGWSLKGRTASALPAPNYDSNKQGKVVVRIWVDRSGNVQKVEVGVKGSTTTDANLLQRAKEAALNSKFSADPNASELQTGIITYDFRKFN